MVFCSAHGEACRSADLLQTLATNEPLSPASFSLSVHNAAAGLFSIARAEKSNHIALSAREFSVEHAVIEACGLLADGEDAVLLVAYDCPLPAVYSDFRDTDEQPYAWAWLIEAPRQEAVTLAWSGIPEGETLPAEDLSPGLRILRFHLSGERSMARCSGRRKWEWRRDA